MKAPRYLVLLLVLLQPGLAEDKELKRLQTALEVANTQTDLNLKSLDLAVYLDRQVVTLEDVIRKDLNGEALGLFDQAAKAWRAYRDAQVASEAEIYRGGSIQPLIRNQTYSRLTRERLDALHNFDPEGKYRQK